MIVDAKIVSKDTRPEDYFACEAKRGEPGFIMSASALKSFGLRPSCPSKWKRGWNPKVTEAKEYGNLADCRLLVPSQFDSRFAVQPATYSEIGMECPSCKSVTDSKSCRKCGEDRIEIKIEKPWSGNATPCKEWASRHTGKQFVSASQFTESDEAIARMMDDAIIAEFLDCSDKQVWIRATWKDEDTGLKVPIRAMLDLVPREGSLFANCLGDLKTTRSAETLNFKSDFIKFGYDIQAAFYRDMFLAANGEGDKITTRADDFEPVSRTVFCFLIQENVFPWEPGHKDTDPETLFSGRLKYIQLLKNYCRCLKSGKWPGFDDTDESRQGWSTIRRDERDEMREQYEPKYNFDDDVEETEEAVFVSEEPT